jgi:two-component system chemotaxis response regulator CheB
MPRLDGVSFVRKQMARAPVPILVLTATAQDGAQAVEALNAGAVDLVQKPTALATEDLLKIRAELVQKVYAAGRASVESLALAPPGIVTPPMVQLTPRAAVSPGAGKLDVIVLGISTGGPQALRYLLPQLPADFPVPIAMVLHMPVGYTALYAEKLNEICQIEVREAKEGDTLRAGLALLAPAGRHLQFRRNNEGQAEALLSFQPMAKPHRPSADVLFRSAAEVFGDRVMAIVMTGMGDDGMEGAAWVKAQGGTVLTEAEKSCVIYGMPRSVVEAGLSDAAIPLNDMVAEIIART